MPRGYNLLLGIWIFHSSLFTLRSSLKYAPLTPNNNPQEYRIFHFFPFHFSLNNVSLFVNISDVFRPFDALRIAMLIASL